MRCASSWSSGDQPHTAQRLNQRAVFPRGILSKARHERIIVESSHVGWLTIDGDGDGDEAGEDVDGLLVGLVRPQDERPHEEVERYRDHGGQEG